MQTVIDWATRNIWYILFVFWGLPLGYYRSKFRKIVYNTQSWTIVVAPRFLLELKALFSNLYPDNLSYLRMRNFYRLYLSVYIALFVCWSLLKG